MTNELPLVHRALVKAGVPIHTLHRITSFDGEAVTLADVYSGAEKQLACRSGRHRGHAQAARDELYAALIGRSEDVRKAGIASVTRIGDCLAPRGHRARGAQRSSIRTGIRDDACRRTPYTRGLSGMSTEQLERTLPTRWYRDRGHFQGGIGERLFSREWVAACREEELPKPGDHRLVDVLGESILLVRNRDNELRCVL